MVALPAPIAGLPVNSAIVWVGPPLLARPEARPGLVTPTRLLLTPLARPPLPIMLYELPAATWPVMSSATAVVPVPTVLSTAIVSYRDVEPA